LYTICEQSLGTACMGWKILVQSSDGDYIGYVCWLLNHCQRLGLEEVSGQYGNLG